MRWQRKPATPFNDPATTDGDSDDSHQCPRAICSRRAVAMTLGLLPGKYHCILTVGCMSGGTDAVLDILPAAWAGEANCPGAAELSTNPIGTAATAAAASRAPIRASYLLPPRLTCFQCSGCVRDVFGTPLIQPVRVRDLTHPPNRRGSSTIISSGCGIIGSDLGVHSCVRACVRESRGVNRLGKTIC